MLAVADRSKHFVDIHVSGAAWAGLLAILIILLVVDLVRHREAHAPTAKEAAIESLGWVVCGVTFGLVILWAYGSGAFGEYISGYLIEKSLSVDNVFVWSMIFTSMAIPVKYQHRVLFWGIFGALALRAIFIFAGQALISKFWQLLLVFGIFLVYTGAKVIRHRDDEEEENSTRGLSLLTRFMPVSDEFDGQHFLTRLPTGAKAATPLLAALVVVEITDLIFAVDSVPAILAVSHEPFLVFASNAFAILGLRAMYFLLADAKERFHYLSHALGAILIFVGLKMTISHWVHINTYLSLGIISIILIAAVVMSQRKAAELAEHAHHPH